MIYEPFMFKKKDLINAHLSKVKQSTEINSKLLGWIQKDFYNQHTLVFSGNVGNGKTYFCAAYFNYLKELKKNVRLYDENAFLNEIRETWEKAGESQGRRIDTITDADYLILDDLASTGAYLDGTYGLRIGLTDSEKKILEELLTSRLEKELPFLITTNFTEKQLSAFFSPKIVSRLFCANTTIVEINIPDRRKHTNF